MTVDGSYWIICDPVQELDKPFNTKFPPPSVVVDPVHPV